MLLNFVFLSSSTPPQSYLPFFFKLIFHFLCIPVSVCPSFCLSLSLSWYLSIYFLCAYHGYNVFLDFLELWGYCTNNGNYGCSREGQYGLLPPIMSGKVMSIPTLRYGIVEIRARIPKGDWIWPGKIVFTITTSEVVLFFIFIVLSCNPWNCC